jgi:Family of unknown function (DUF6152)
MEWVNPHGWVYVDVKGEDGKVVNWAVETGGPNAPIRRGLRKNRFPGGNPGDRYRISGKEWLPDRQRQDAYVA